MDNREWREKLWCESGGGGWAVDTVGLNLDGMGTVVVRYHQVSRSWAMVCVVIDVGTGSRGNNCGGGGNQELCCGGCCW